MSRLEIAWYWYVDISGGEYENLVDMTDDLDIRTFKIESEDLITTGILAVL